VLVCVSRCRAHQRQAGRDGETVTGPPEHVEPDDDKSSLNSAIASVHPGEGSSSVALLQVSSLFSP